MFRNTATRSLLKSFQTAPASRSSYSAATASLRNVAARPLSNKRPQILLASRPTTSSLFYATKSPIDKVEEAAEKKLAEQKIEADPSHVSAESSVRHVFEEQGETAKNNDEDMLAGIKADLKTVKETFSLNEVPKESLYIGAAGLLPYAATSLSTVYLAWDINHAHTTPGGSGLLFSPETAHQLLEMITPVQIGFGAVIISFLGAIHWGLEYAGYGGYHSYRRYMYGVIAPAIAWPTLLMPVEYALITQFVAFNFMYFADARATVRGWFPPWYSTYRFVLTFIVGASIIVTLVGRGQIVTSDESTLKSPIDYVKEDRDSQWEALEQEEKERRAKLVKEEEEDSEEDDGEDEAKEDEDAKKDEDKDAKKDDGKDDKGKKDKKADK